MNPWEKTEGKYAGNSYFLIANLAPYFKSHSNRILRMKG